VRAAARAGQSGFPTIGAAAGRLGPKQLRMARLAPGLAPVALKQLLPLKACASLQNNQCRRGAAEQGWCVAVAAGF
jgi:hypothetical protein